MPPGWIFLGRADEMFDAYMSRNEMRIAMRWQSSAMASLTFSSYQVDYIREIGFTSAVAWGRTLILFDNATADADPSISPNA